jgi:hypothetical protein
MTRILKIAFILIGIILIAACSKIAPIDQETVPDDGPSFILKNGDADNMNGDGNSDDGSGGSITDPDDDDDEIDNSNSGSGITDPDDDDDEIDPGSDGHKPGGNAGGSGGNPG